MVHSAELGYDPDEWEECPESDHLSVMSMFTRVCLSIGTLMASALFFWLLEVNKRRHRHKDEGQIKTEQQQQRHVVDGRPSTQWEREDEETVESKFARAAEEAALKAQPERRRNSKRTLSREEEAELLAWKAEVQRTVETRLRASQEPDSDEERTRDHGGTSEHQAVQQQPENNNRSDGTAAEEDQLEQQAAKQQQQQQHPFIPHEQQQLMEKLPEASATELLVPMSEWAKTKQLIRVVQQSDDHRLSHPGATPPSTPPGGIRQPELAAHYRQMADELTQKLKMELAEMELEEMDSAQMAERLQRRHREDIIGALEGTAASPEVRHRLALQLEGHVVNVVAQEMRKRASFSSGGGTAGEGDGVPSTAQQVAGEEHMLQPQRHQSPPLRREAHSSEESSEDDFVKVERQLAPANPPTLLEQEKAAMEADDGTQHGLSPSPQMGGPITEEQEEQVRVSMFEGDGGSTTADEIEYVPAMLEQQQSKCSESASLPPFDERSKQRPLGAEEAEQMLALLQEYDLSAGDVLNADRILPPADDSSEQRHLWGRQVSSGGVISLPGSTQRTTPAGSSSVPESPDSAAFGFVNILPSGGGEKERDASTEEANGQQQQTKQSHGKESEPQQQQRTNGTETAPTVAVDFPIDAEQKQKENGTMAELGRQMLRKKEGESVKTSSFIVEEEMLESVADEAADKWAPDKRQGTMGQRRTEEAQAKPERDRAKGEQQQQQQLLLLVKNPEAVAEAASGSSPTMATSRQIGTNEAFGRPAEAALLFEDIDDKDVTYAPEIQSLEVPPDQLSQADSLNLVDEEQFSEEHQQMVIGTCDEKMTNEQQRLDKENAAEQTERHAEAAAPQRELTPHEEHNLQRIIDRLRRTPSPPRRQKMGVHAQVPQAPQFLRSYFNDESTSSLSSTSIRQSSLLSALGVTSTQEMLLRLTSLEALSDAMRKAGLESSNLIFGIDYTASNKYQGERSFGGQSLHSIESRRDNPYQTVIKIMGRTLAPFAGHEHVIPVFGFGDSTTGDWTVFSLNEGKDCENLEEVLSVYNRVTPQIDLSGPTNFAPLIYRAMEICQQRRDYHILVIIADGQVTNEKATVKAIVSACQFPLSIIVVGVGDGPWEMMRIFDESLPKRPWDNFHFVELHELITQRADQPIESRELAFAVHSLLEIPDQYATIRKMGLLTSTAFFTRPPSHSPRRSKSPKAPPQGIKSGTMATTAEEGTEQQQEQKETNC